MPNHKLPITVEEWEDRKRKLKKTLAKKPVMAPANPKDWNPASTYPTLTPETLLEVYMCGYKVTRKLSDIPLSLWRLSVTKWRVLS